jgi:hypothetical protein
MTPVAYRKMRRVKLDVRWTRADYGDCYVYVIFDGDGVPRYVGKGTGKRSEQHRKPGHYNFQMRRLYRQCDDPPVVKVREGLTHAEAYVTEMALIAAIGRGKDGPLFNFTDGGDGANGYVQSSKTRQLHRKALKGKPKSEAHRAALKKAWENSARRAALKLRVKLQHANMSEKTRAARSAKLRGAWTEEKRAELGAKISASRRGKPLTEAQLAIVHRMNEAHRIRRAELIL